VLGFDGRTERFLFVHIFHVKIECVFQKRRSIRKRDSIDSFFHIMAMMDVCMNVV
jgi:hypothetical protein